MSQRCKDSREQTNCSNSTEYSNKKKRNTHIMSSDG